MFFALMPIFINNSLPDKYAAEKKKCADTTARRKKKDACFSLRSPTPHLTDDTCSGVCKLPYM